MAVITSIRPGRWNSTATWDTSTIPGTNDTVHIKHDITIDLPDPDPVTGYYFIYAYAVYIEDGSLTVDDTVTYADQILVTFYRIYLSRRLNDTRLVRLDGLRFYGGRIVPAISCIKPGDDGYPDTPTIEENLSSKNILFSDPGWIGMSAKLQDITPEGCGRAYARKVSNNVRYMTVTVRIRNSSNFKALGSLYRMAEGPFQVLLVTNAAIIKGHIETIAPDAGSVGQEYISVRITVAEG